MTTPPKMDDPIEAAMAWLNNPEYGGHLDSELRSVASQAIDVAKIHVDKLMKITERLNAGYLQNGFMDSELLFMADSESKQIEEFSLKLRSMLDKKSDLSDAKERILLGLEKAKVGGLAALTSSFEL